jgi:hypothetical protein
MRTPIENKRTRRSHRAWRSAAAVFASLAFTLVLVAPASAVPAPIATPSDPRAEFFEGNATTCAQIGVEPAIQIGGAGSAAGADAYVSGTTREDRYLDLAITAAGAAAGVVIDAVVVKGGDGFNLYTDPQVLPPIAAPPQGYFPPSVGAGNIARISHWFVCYHFTELPTGSLVISKQIIAPPSIPMQSLPSSFTALVSCDSPGFEPVAVTFGLLGGVALDAGTVMIEGLPTGTTCTLQEQGTDAFPPGTVVSFSPSSTVQIGDAAGVQVSVVNDFSGIALLQGSLTITKVVESAVGGDVPTEFAIEYACTDGTAGTLTLPGSGGTAAPIVTTAGTYCAIAEAPGSLPPGWTVVYQHGDETSTTGLIVPVFETPVSVTVTNTEPMPTPTPTPTPTPGTDPADPELAPTGAEAPIAWLVLSAVLLIGGMAGLMTRRSARRR